MIPARLLPLTRLLQLASPGLPVGAYAYSEGLEQAVEAGWIRGPDDVEGWLAGLLEHALARLDLPLLGRLQPAFAAGDGAAAERLSRWLAASRETRELRAADRDLGQALARLLAGLDVAEAGPWRRREHCTYAAMTALAGARWRIPVADGACAYAFAWAENLVAAAVKLVPLGQSAGQRILFRIAGRIPAVCAAALARADADIGAGAMGLAIASARHEIQHTRLFRS